MSKKRKITKRIISLLIAILTVLSIVPLYASADGEVWHEIYTVEDLYAVNNDLTANYKLMNDIDLTEATAPGGDYDFMGNGWDPIGGGHIYGGDTPFSGVFDGNGYSINGMRIYYKTAPSGVGEYIYCGLFSSVSGTIKNLTVAGTIHISGHYVGGICGILSGNIDNCQSYVSIDGSTNGDSFVGGIVGLCRNNGKITNSSSLSDLYFFGGGYYSDINHHYYQPYISGIAGRNNGLISGCFYSGKINFINTGGWYYSARYQEYHKYAYISGISCYGNVTNCFNFGTITASPEDSYTSYYSNHIYGISYSGTVINSYNAGELSISGSGEKFAVSDSTSTNCYYLAGTGSSNAGSTSLSEAQMKSKTFFGGFDFDTVWEIYPDSSYPYPQLRSNRLDVTAGAESIEISQLPTKLSYLEGKDELNLAGGRVTVTYNDGSTREIAMTNDMVTGFDNTKVGTQTLTVTLGRFTATFDVTVVAKSLSGISVSQLPTKTEYIEGLEAFDAAGGKLSLLYNNDTSEEVDLSVAQITGFDNTKVGLQTLTARFNGFTTTFQIEIIAKSVASIEVYKLPEKLTYLEAKDTLDVTGGKVKVIYNNGTNDVIDMTADMISGFNNTRVGPLTLTVTYSGKTATFDVEIIAKSIASISMSALPAKLNYIEGLEELNVAGGKVKLNYNNGTSAVVDLTDDMVAGFDNSTVGKCKVDVYYEGCETSFEVNIIAKSVSSIEMARYPDKLVYLEAKDALDVAGGWIRVYCNNNTEEEIELTSSMVSGFSNTKIGTQNLTVTYQGKKTSYEIEVIAKSLIGIEIANLPAKLTYLEGKDQLSVTGGRIKLLYDNDTENVISITAAMVTGFDNTVVGKQTLTINYEGFAAEYEIEIIAKSVSSIYFDTKPSKTSFVESRETLDVSGGKLHVNYNNGTYGIVEVTPDMVDGFDNTKIGRQTLTVSYGGKSITYSIEVVHDYVPTVVDPKCTESGYTLYTCAACGDFYKANYTSPLGHSFTNYVSNNDATCTEDGTKTAKCDRCDVTDTVSDAGSKLGHNYKAKVTAPTCTEKGFTTYTCSRCNDTYTSDEKNALGHSFTNYVSNNDATCTKDGTKTAKCDRCDATDTKKDKNSAKGHTPGNWEIIKYSTQTEKGVRVKKCTVCGAELEREETEPIVNPFKDLPEGKWYTDAALWCYARGLISGTGADAFSPNSTLSRAMFVQILAKADGVDLSKYEYSGRFADVKANNWYAKAVEWAVSCGVTNGTGANAFSPNNAVTREQLATFFLAYAKYKGYDVSAKTDLTAYADHAKISKWAETAISWAVAEKLISGTGNNMLSPKGTATRAQAAVIFKNFIEVYKAKQ